jgi:hypothetical protein
MKCCEYGSWGLYYKTFYSKNCCRICWQGWSLPEWSHLQDSTRLALSVAYKHYTRVEVNGRANTLAYYDLGTITAVKCFIVQAPVVDQIKHFRSYFTHTFCKLDRFRASRKIFYSNKMVQLTKMSA